jgi:hypothetical protein
MEYGVQGATTDRIHRKISPRQNRKGGGDWRLAMNLPSDLDCTYIMTNDGGNLASIQLSGPILCLHLVHKLSMSCTQQLSV